jgi:hypothetical protein
MNFKLIGIGGVAQAGKDSLYKALYSLEHSFIRSSFADKVKEDLRPALYAQYKIDIFNCTPAEKEICRDTIVFYANLMRDKTNGLHWINEVEPTVLSQIESNLIPVITDVRYVNEADWIHKIGGKVVHLKKFSYKDGEKKYHPPANEVEAKNDPLLQEVSDLSVEWENNLTPPQMIEFAKNLLIQL